MHYFPAALQELADQFARLPGIGGKTAQRLAFYMLSLSEEEAQNFSDAILAAKKTVHTCPVCQNITDRELCPICDDEDRDSSVICVVAEPKDVIALERSREYRGVYHVLHGVISPLNHVTQDDIKIRAMACFSKSGLIGTQHVHSFILFLWLLLCYFVLLMLLL